MNFRYLLVNVICEKKVKVSQSDIASQLKKSVQKFYGDFGAASITNFAVKYFNEKHKLLIIRISHGPHRFLTSIIPLLTRVTQLLGGTSDFFLTLLLICRLARNWRGFGFSTWEQPSDSVKNTSQHIKTSSFDKQ